MKKSIIIATFLVAVIVIVGLISCSKSNITENNNETSEFVNPYSFIGEKHNDGLDYVLQSIKTFNKSNELSKNDFADYVSERYYEFCVNNIENYETMSDLGILSYEQISDLLIPNSRTTFLDSIIANADISDKQRQYLEKIASTIIDFSNTYELQDSLDVLNLNIRNDQDLADEEKIILFGASSISICSYEYWSENIEEWVNTLNEALDLEIDADDYQEAEIRNIAAADIAGLIAGGIIGGFIGGGIIPSAIGGGLAASLYQLIYPWLCEILQ